MTEKQKRFADEYLVDLNATQSAIRAGYSSKTAYSIGQQLLKKLEIQNYINERLEAKKKRLIASQDEILEFLTKGMRQELEEEVISVEGIAKSETVVRVKKISAKDSIKCAELLGKRYGLYTDKVDIDGKIGVTIVDDLDE